MKCVYCGGTIPVRERWDTCPAHPAGGGHDTMTMEQRAAIVARVNRFQKG